MVKFGQVTAYDPQTGMAEISYIRPDACAKCGACSSLNKTGKITLQIPASVASPASCAPGSWVKVFLPDGKFLSAAALAYALPLLGFLAGLLLGYFLSGKQDLWAVLGGLAGIGLCLPFL